MNDKDVEDLIYNQGRRYWDIKNQVSKEQYLRVVRRRELIDFAWTLGLCIALFVIACYLTWGP